MREINRRNRNRDRVEALAAERAALPAIMLRALLAALAALAAVAAAAASSLPLLAAEPQTEGQPYRGGFVQRESVQILVLDVEVLDDQGNPVRGLTKEDFELKLDYRTWPIYSVDDLCSAPGEGDAPARPDPRAGGPALQAASSGSETVLRDAATRYVLYFDLGLLQWDGRMRAREAALRWVRDVHPPGGQAMVVIQGTRPGLVDLTGWTADEAALEKAILRAFEDPKFRERFPDQLEDRMAECVACIRQRQEMNLQGSFQNMVNLCCGASIRAEYEQGRRSLDAMELFLSGLEMVPGHKAVILFQQNLILSPGTLYMNPKAGSRVGSHLPQLEELGAVATAARASVYPIHSGDRLGQGLLGLLAREAVILNANLADFTGGATNHGPVDLHQVVESAGREGGCVYRIAFRPKEEDGTKVHRAQVKALGRRVPHNFRVQSVSDADRALRVARALLRGAGGKGSLAVTAALVPREAGKRRWSLAVQVALDPATLNGVAIGGREAADLEIGALLHREESGETWELQGGTRVTRQARKAGDKASAEGFSPILLYDVLLEEMKPGTYELRAYVRNRTIEQHGFDEDHLLVPKTRKGGLTGPVASLPGRTVYASALRVLDRDQVAEADRVVHASRGAAPLSESGIRRGDLIAVDSWICPEPGERDTEAGAFGERLVRVITKDRVPIYRLPDAVVERSGPCVRVADLFHTYELAPGRYVYRAFYAGGEKGSGAAAHEVPFVVSNQLAPGAEELIAASGDRAAP